MTNFNNATRSFDLCAEGTESYSWAWEGINRTETLAEIEATNNDIIAYAHGWACELCNACIDQISPEGERGFTAEEITNDLIVDRHALADALQAWLEGEYDQDEQDDEGEPDEPDPQPIGVEVAVRLLEEGFIEEGAGIYINRANGHAGGYDISVDSDDEALYEVVWVHGINASHEAMTKEEVITLIREEAELGARFYWQVMENGEWELTNAPYLQSLEVIEEDEETSDEAYLGESTLAKVRRQKELLLGDREEMFPSRRTAPVPPVQPEHKDGFFICTSSVQGNGKTPDSMIYAFSDKADFLRQNPSWFGVELPKPRWFGVVVMDTTQSVDGGFQLGWEGWHDAIVHAPFIY